MPHMMIWSTNVARKQGNAKVIQCQMKWFWPIETITLLFNDNVHMCDVYANGIHLHMSKHELLQNHSHRRHIGNTWALSILMSVNSMVQVRARHLSLFKYEYWYNITKKNLCLYEENWLWHMWSPPQWAQSNDQGEPAVSYRWTGWVWGITGWHRRLQENTDHFRGIYKTYPNLIKENRRMPTCNRLDLQTLGSQPIMPKISAITGTKST